MKTSKQKKNDRAAFFNLPASEYFDMSQKRRRTWRKQEPKQVALTELIEERQP